jgi:hypothetical protein
MSRTDDESRVTDLDTVPQRWAMLGENGAQIGAFPHRGSYPHRGSFPHRGSTSGWPHRGSGGASR